MTTLVRSSEQPQPHPGGAVLVVPPAAGNSNGNTNTNFQRSHSSYSSSSSSGNSSGGNHSGGSAPWDQQRDYAAIEVVKNNDIYIDNSGNNSDDNAEDMRTTTTVYEPSDFTTTHDDYYDNEEDLNDGELPSLTPRMNAGSTNNSVTSPRNSNNSNNSYTTGLGRILGQAMPTTRPMQPPSQAGAVRTATATIMANDATLKNRSGAASSNNNKAQQRKFWGQMDEERQTSSSRDIYNTNMDNEEDGPHDEIAARRAARAIVSSVRQQQQQQQQGRRPQGVYDQDNNNNGEYQHQQDPAGDYYDQNNADTADQDGYQGLGGVESMSLSNASEGGGGLQHGETMTVDSSEDAATQAQSFCGQTLAAIGEMCGTSLALTQDNHSTNKIDKTSRNRQQGIREESPWDGNRSNKRKQVERQEEHTAIEVEFVEPPKSTAATSSALAAKKNAYLNAMAAKAKSDFDSNNKNNNKHDNDGANSTTSTTTSAVVIGPTNNANMDIYGSFGAQEKRKFLKMINSGKSPSEASQRIVAERKAAAQKKQEAADKKKQAAAARIIAPRLAFWRKNKKSKNKGQEQVGGAHDDDEHEDELELASSPPPSAAQKSANAGGGGSSYVTTSSDGSGHVVEGEDSRSTESPSPPPPPPPPDGTTIAPPPASSSASASSAASSSRPASILKRQQQLTVDIPSPTSPNDATAASSVTAVVSPASPNASTSVASAKSPSVSSALSAPPSDTAFYHRDKMSRNYPSSTSSVPQGQVSGSLTTPTSPGSRSAQSMPVTITPGLSSSAHYLSSPVTSGGGGGGGHSGYVSPVSASYSALSAPVSPTTSALAMSPRDGKSPASLRRNNGALSPPIADRKPLQTNYVSPTSSSMLDLPPAAVAAMRSLETTNTSPLESNIPKVNYANDPLISRPDVDHDDSEGVDEDEYHGTSSMSGHQPQSQISAFAPSGINYYDAVRRDPHSDVDDEMEAAITSVARGPNKNAKGSTLMKLKKGPRLVSVSKPRGFAALTDRPRQEQPQQQQRSRSAPRAMRLAERARSVSPSPPPWPTPPLPLRLLQRDQSPPRALSEPGDGISPTRSRAPTTNSAKSSILQSAARSLTQAKLASDTDRRASGSVTGNLLDTPSQDTDASAVKWVEEEVIRRNASLRSGLSSSVSGDIGEMESQRHLATASAAATPSQEAQSLPVVTPTRLAEEDRSIRPVSPPIISHAIESATSSPNERAGSIASGTGQRAVPDSPTHSVKSVPVVSSSHQIEKEDEPQIDTKAMEIDMDTYLSSMDEIATHNGANFDSQSVYTSATGASSYTQSSRKRRPGAAKERLAKTKGANQKKNGWHESIRAAATKTNREWEPESGWKDYRDPDAISPKSDERIHINLEHMRSRGSKDDTHVDGVRRSSDESVSVPFPKEWETEREKMLDRGSSHNVAAARVAREEPRAARMIEMEPFTTKQMEIKPVMIASRGVEAKPKAEDIADTLPSIDLIEPPIPLDGPPRVVGRTTPKRMGGASPHRARPTDVASRPIGWLESMRAASAAIATDGRTWDPETGWVADGDEDDDSIPDVVDFDAPSAVKDEPAYEEDDEYQEPETSKAALVRSRETSPESIPTNDDTTEKEELRRVLPAPSRDSDGKLRQWVEKSEKTVHDISATQDSDRAVASSNAVNDIYIQLGDNGSVRSQPNLEKDQQDSEIALPMAADTVDFGTSPGLEFTGGDNEDEDARLLDTSCVFPSEDERPLSPPIRIKKEKIAPEDLRLFPPAESQDKRAGRRVAAAVAATAKREKLKQARETKAKYSKEARAAQEYEERREAARLAAYTSGENKVKTTMQRSVASPPRPQHQLQLDPNRKLSTPPRSTKVQESGQRTPSSPPSPPLTRASGPITPSPQPLGRVTGGKKPAPQSAPDKPMYPAEFQRKHSGPIDLDEVDDDWDSDEDQQQQQQQQQQNSNNDWESRSSSPASLASKSKLTKPVPKLKASKRDTSPVRVRKEPAPAPLAPPVRPSPEPEPQDTYISSSRGSSPTEEMLLNSVPLEAPESPSVKERLRHWEAIVHEQPERREEKTSKVVTRSGKGEALKSSVEKRVFTERTVSSGGLESEDRRMVTERAVSSANDENGDWESYVETTVVSERVVSTRDGSNVVERTMTTTQKGVRSSPTNEIVNGKLLRKSRDDLFKGAKSEDEDSLFEFGDKREANALVHSRLSPIRPVDDPDTDDEKTPSENLSVSDAYGPDPSDRRSFLQRLTECAAPVMAGRGGMAAKTGDVPSAHLAFMSGNHVQGSTAGRFVPPNLCGRPENIIEELEDDESVQSSPPGTQLARLPTPPPTEAQRPKSAPRAMRGGDVRPTSSGSVVSDGFGAKTAYLEALAMKTAVSKPRKSKGRSGSSVASGTSRASATSSQHSEKWKAFLDRKKNSSDPSAFKSRGSTSELSTAAERYAAAKLEEMMAKMSEQSRASRAQEDDEYEHEYGRSMEENSRLIRKEKADLASYVRGRKLVEEARKTESVSAAHDLAAARVEAMMAALSSPQMEDDQAEI